MYRKLICIPATLTLLAAEAQPEGFVTGTFSYSSTVFEPDGSEDQAASTVTVGPMVGRHLSPKDVIGFGIDYTRNVEDVFVYDPFFGFIGGAERTKNILKLRPFYRMVKNINETFSIYGQISVGVGFGTSHLSGDVSDEDVRINAYDLSLAPGVFYSFADHWAISAEWAILGYSVESETTKGQDDEDSTDVTKEVEVGFTLSDLTIGLNWLF